MYDETPSACDDTEPFLCITSISISGPQRPLRSSPVNFIMPPCCLNTSLASAVSVISPLHCEYVGGSKPVDSVYVNLVRARQPASTIVRRLTCNCIPPDVFWIDITGERSGVTVEPFSSRLVDSIAPFSNCYSFLCPPGHAQIHYFCTIVWLTSCIPGHAKYLMLSQIPFSGRRG